ncbi:hypothetical protein [Hymenobacter psychrophilus]|uniref:hypothetical protein n=1 Tax=Hymenobacter psychrophilus TaxID=651662 RepID=UPI000B832E90|nr:hypothetical protein [Hymenobacter psychrophilus]
MPQSYGIVTPDSSSARLIFSDEFSLLFIFQANGLTDAPFGRYFATQKKVARAASCSATTIQLNFSSLFHYRSWQTRFGGGKQPLNHPVFQGLIRFRTASVVLE